MPLNRVQNSKFRQFLETFCNKNVPHESTLRKNYVCSIYNNVITEIKNHIKNQFLYIIVDETTDRGQYIANLLIGVLNQNILPNSFLISTKQLEKTNSSEIVRFVNESLMTLFAPDILPTDKILLLITDAAAYMTKAGTNLKFFYKNLIHVTCLAHGINRVAELIRCHFPLVNSLITNVKKVFIKAPLRVQVYKERLPNIPLPPEPVITRWGTWLDAAIFYANNYSHIKDIVLDFADSAESIKKSKSFFEKREIMEQLTYIKAHYSFVSGLMKKLETNRMPLLGSISIVEHCENLLKIVPGETGKTILNKFYSVTIKNEGFQTLTAIAKILSLNAINNALDLNPEHIAALKYAPITSVDIERTFSMYKNILSDIRQNMEKQLIVNWYNMLNICEDE